MISGTGIDIIEIERIQAAINRWGRRFLDHIFNQEEIEYAEQFKHTAQHYAVRFAAKEAVFKAIGDDPTITWKDITIFKDKFGKPLCRLNRPGFDKNILISLSHSKHYAVANAIVTSK